MPLKAITFDLWLTLIWDSAELEEYRKLRRLVNFHRFVKRVHTPGRTAEKVSFNSVRLAMEELNEKVKSYYEDGQDVSPEQRGRMLFELLGIKFSHSETELVYTEAGEILSNSGYYRKYPNVNPEAEKALRALKDADPNLKIGLISNAARSSKTYRRMLGSLGIGKYFDNLTISSEVGFLKPRKEIFESAVRNLSVAPSETLHVGDLFKADVVGATSVGMNAALYTGLWHKYSEVENVRSRNKMPDWAGERIPSDFEVDHHRGVFVKEISRLNEVVDLVQNAPSVN